jgi:hypothetical protein
MQDMSNEVRARVRAMMQRNRVLTTKDNNRWISKDPAIQGLLLISTHASAMFNDLLLSFAESQDTKAESGLLKGEVDVVERRMGNVERIIEIARRELSNMP